MKKTTTIFFLLIITFFACEKDNIDNDLTNDIPFIEFTTSPAALNDLKTGDTVTMGVNASDSIGGIKNVRYYLNNQLMKTITDTPYSYSYIFKKEGHNPLMAIAADSMDERASTDTLYAWVQSKDNLDFDIRTNPWGNFVEYNDIEFTIYSNSPHGEINKTALYINHELYAQDTSDELITRMDSVPAGEYSYYAYAIDETGKETRSEEKVIVVNENKPPNVEITHPDNGAKYYPGESIWIAAEANDLERSVVKTEFYINDSLFITKDGHPGSFWWYDAPFGECELMVKVYDDRGLAAQSEKVHFFVRPGMQIDGAISAFHYSESDNLVFALNKTKDQLMLINPNNSTTERVDLPFNNPVSMDYTLDDRKLYIAYASNASLSIWDNQSQNLSSFEVTDNAEGSVVKTDSQNRRIYFSTAENRLYIIDMDSQQNLLEDALFEGPHFSIDKQHQWLFAAETRYSTSELRKYSVQNDELNHLQTNNEDDIQNPKYTLIHPNNSYVLISSTYGNNTNHELYAYDTENIKNIIGAFNIGDSPAYNTLTPDGEKLIGLKTNLYEDEIYVINAETFTREKSIPYIDADYNFKLTTNYSGTKLIAFTTVYDDKDIIYFINL